MKHVKHWIGKFVLTLFGWRVESCMLRPQKFVMIAAPHTSNWDLLFMLAAASVLGLRPSWIGKHTLFVFPLGLLLRSLGGIPIDRRSLHNTVEQIAQAFESSESLVIAVPPEGTRGSVRYWKSGFYQVARRAKVPIAMSFLDYPRKVAGVGEFLMPSGDVRADMERIREFYRDIIGKYPHNMSVPRLREEEEIV